MEGKENGNKTRSASRATQVPDTFPITAEMRAWVAANVPVKTNEIEVETSKFQDYYRANGKTMKDWIAAWHNWMRNSPNFDRPGKTLFSKPDVHTKNLETFRNFVGGTK